MAPTIEISPDILQFSLQDADSAKVILKITSQKENVLFKVKTTKPRLYVVRPNQGLVAPGQTCEVTIVMNDRDRKQLVAAAAAAGGGGAPPPPPGACGDKFLVQTAPLAAAPGGAGAAADRLARAEGKERQDQLVELWASFDASVINGKKLLVQHYYPTGASEGPAAAAAAAGPAAAAAAGQRGEAAALQAKYDGLVKFTVELTEERDALKAALETAKGELSHERRGRRQLEAAAAGESKGKPVPRIKRPTKAKKKGFSLVFVLLVAGAAFYCGRHPAYSKLLDPVLAFLPKSLSSQLLEKNLPHLQHDDHDDNISPQQKAQKTAATSTERAKVSNPRSLSEHPDASSNRDGKAGATPTFSSPTTPSIAHREEKEGHKDAAQMPLEGKEEHSAEL